MPSKIFRCYFCPSAQLSWTYIHRIVGYHRQRKIIYATFKKYSDEDISVDRMWHDHWIWKCLIAFLPLYSAYGHSVSFFFFFYMQPVTTVNIKKMSTSLSLECFITVDMTFVQSRCKIVYYILMNWQQLLMWVEKVSQHLKLSEVAQVDQWLVCSWQFIMDVCYNDVPHSGQIYNTEVV